MKKYIYKSGIELAQLIRTGQATSVDVVEEHLEQINRYNNSLNAVVIHTENEALETAKACDEEVNDGIFRGTLHGVPMTIKEQYWLKGQKSTINANWYKNWVAPEDAVIVDRLKRAGAVILGKTNIPKYLFDYQVWGDIYPDGKNPYNVEYSPGGSSGGAAAALASGMVPLELGGDFGGSIRIPSYFCGVFGMKPTENTLPNHGMVPKLDSDRGYVFKMAAAGPMARTIEDMELLWKILRGPHHSERDIPRIEWKNAGDKKLDDFKIGWVDQWPDYQPSEETQTLIRDFVELLQVNGVKTENSVPEKDLHTRSLSLWTRLSGIVLGQDLPMLMKPFAKFYLQRTVFRGMKKYKRELNQSLKSSFINYSETMGIRTQIISEWEQYFKDYDLLICPMSYGPAYKRCKVGSELSYGGKSMIYSNYCWPYVVCFNASGHPAMNIPLGLNKYDLPVGIQVVGAYWSEPIMIRFAKLVSKHIPGFVRPDGY